MRLNIRFDQENEYLYNMLKQISSDTGIPLNHLIIGAIKERYTDSRPNLDDVLNRLERLEKLMGK